MPKDALIGREILGQYVIRERIGEGGMGEVYLADQPAFGRSAVIKVLSKQGAARGDAAERFAVEARAASRIGHPNIVTVYNVGELEDGTLYLAMEHIDGPSLHEVIRRDAPFAPSRAVAIAKQIADALAEAHRRGVIHRDLKPSNVMLIPRGARGELVKVLDFGIAKLEGVDLTRTGLVFGTPVYMSPEQFNGSALDGRADLYALGVVLFEMLTGKPPFEADTAVGYMAKHLTEPPRVPAHVPPGLAAVLGVALAKDPKDRHASLDAFSRELDSAMAAAADAPPTVELAVASAAAMTPVAAATRVLTRVLTRGTTWKRLVGALRVWAAAARRHGRMLWARTAGRFGQRRPPTIVERFTGVLENVGLKRRRTWRERLLERASALIGRRGR